MSEIKYKNKSKRHFSVVFCILGVILMLYAAFMIMLIWWGFTASVKATSGTVNLFRNHEFGMPQGWPWQWQWSNYSTILDYIYVDVYTATSRVRVRVLGMIGNSLIYAIGGAIWMVFVPTIAAYATARIRYKFNIVIDTIVLVCMAIPIIGATPSMLQVLKTLHLYDTWPGFFIMNGHIIGVHYLILQATLRSVPASFSESAMIDGAGYYTIMFRIIMPLAVNVMMTLVLINFITLWNDYMTPLIYLKSYPTLAYGVFYLVFVNSENIISNAPMRMAGSFMLFIPILILYFIFKDTIMGNLSMGGLKE